MKITQRKIKKTKYYSSKFLMINNEKKLLIKLKKYADDVLTFGNMINNWFIIKGDYYPDSALNPNEPVIDFDDIANEYGLRELSYKPYPEKNWVGKWEKGEERLKKLLLKN